MQWFVEGGGAVLHAEPNPAILYSTIARLPQLSPADQVNSTQQFYRELNRFGLTSVIDPGGGGHAYPADYEATRVLAGRPGFPLRISKYLFAQKSGGGNAAAHYLLASYSVFGMITASLFAFGAGVAVERAHGWMTLKRATPMPVGAYLGAKVAAAMVFGTIILVSMGLCAVTLGGVRLPAAVWLRIWAVLVLGCVPFCLAGLIIAFTVPPTGPITGPITRPRTPVGKICAATFGSTFSETSVVFVGVFVGVCPAMSTRPNTFGSTFNGTVVAFV